MYIDLGWDAEKVIAIPNGIDINRFKLQKPKTKFQESLQSQEKNVHSLHLGCIARLSGEKGVNVLMQAVSRLPDIMLNIVGSGMDEGYIRTLIAEMTGREGIQRVRLFPSVQNPADFYRSIDVLVLPSSDHDPFGMVAAEAMMLGVPVIVENDVRAAAWDLSQVHLVDPKTGVVLCRAYPLDKSRNADGRRATRVATLDAVPAAPAGMAPLLEKLIAQYTATGLPPAYLPKAQREDLP
jgi:glycosyltransferase involved in cell wall biosynthesis